MCTIKFLDHSRLLPDVNYRIIKRTSLNLWKNYGCVINNLKRQWNYLKKKGHPLFLHVKHYFWKMKIKWQLMITTTTNVYCHRLFFQSRYIYIYVFTDCWCLFSSLSNGKKTDEIHIEFYGLTTSES